MQLIVLTGAELDALYGEPADVFKTYVCLRRRMDFASGLVGAEVELSWWALREDMYVEFAQGRHRDESGTPTEKRVRNKVDRLVKLGLIEHRTCYRKLVFYLPKAHRDKLVLKKVGRTLVGQAGRTLVVSESIETTTFDDVKNEEVGRTLAGEVGHTSGIRKSTLSEIKQQHTAGAVDNSALLQFSKIADWLKTVEKRRGKILSIKADNHNVKSWVLQGVGADELDAAHAMAVADREKQASAAPISPGFLDIFVQRVVVKRVPWFASWSGIVTHGAGLGITQSSEETDPAFKARVFAAAGMTDEEARKWQA